MMNGMPAMGFMMWLFMLIFWGLFILGLVVAVRWYVDRGKTKPGGGRHRDSRSCQFSPGRPAPANA